jgi:16S rRNA (cytosine1402-N4)-methyltransferase
MAAELLELLAPRFGARAADLTVGAGGHAAALLTRIGDAGRLLALDRDASALALSRARLADDNRVAFAKAKFSDFGEACDAFARFLGSQPARFDAILMDLGVSSMQLDEAARGFSFQREGALDLRMDPEDGGPTAADLVNGLPEEELADLLYRLGEERASRRIARLIVSERRRRRIATTTQLSELVRRAVPHSKADSGRIHPATRTFQALRIAVNRELEELPLGLAAALERLAPGGRLAVLSYHSLEDRIVKHRFRDAVAAGGFALLTKKALRPSEAEAAANPRARSAKLRAITKNPTGGAAAPGGVR